MKFCIVGEWKYHQYEESFGAGLEYHGHNVIKFPLSSYFKSNFLSVQFIFPFLSVTTLYRIYKDLLSFSKVHSPDVILLWRCRHILPSLIDKLRRNGVLVVIYNNDNPFYTGKMEWYRRYAWYWYIKNISRADLTLVYRPSDVKKATSLNAKKVEILRSYFLPWQDRPIHLNNSEKLLFECDVVFVGHYESDGREEYIKALMDNGINVRLYGGKYWTKKVLGSYYDSLSPIKNVTGDNYTKALCGAKICLCFLSSINKDKYTRRCFEIPASKSLLLSERTSELKKMFFEDKEAVFFSSIEEMVGKVKFLLKRPEEIARISNSGYLRVVKDKHSVVDRAYQFTKMVERCDRFNFNNSIDNTKPKLL